MLAAAAIAAAGLGAPAPATVIDRVVARVNGEVITLYDLYKAELPLFGKVILPGQSDVKTPQDRGRERDLLDKLIEERLLLQRAGEKGIRPDPAAVEAAIADLKKEKDLTDEMFARALQERGIPLAEYRERIGRQMVISRLFNSEVRLKVVVSQEEVAQYYKDRLPDYVIPERLKVRHILLLKGAGEGEAERARASAQMVAELLAGGADFEETARRHSQDSSQHKGEVSGWIQRGDVLPELERIVFELGQGSVSPLIETQMGYHIMKVEMRETARTRSLQEVSGEITQRLMDEKTTARYKAWLEEIRGQSAIDIKL